MDITPELEIQIVEEYKNGLSRLNIIKKYNSHDKKILEILKKNDVPIRNLSDSHYVFKFDKTFFKKIDSEEKAYWLGFIYADGNVHKNRFQICLHPQDESHLVKLKQALKSESTIKNDRKYKRFGISNVELANDLLNLGCMPQKTFKIKFPTEDQVPRYLIRHFMRGYFDGDGCITYSKKKNTNNLIKWKFEVISCLDFITEYKNILISQTQIETFCLVREKRREKPIYILNIGAQTNLRLNKLYDFLYSNANIYLERKRNKFIELNNKLLQNSELRELNGTSQKIGLIEKERRMDIMQEFSHLPLKEVCIKLGFSQGSVPYLSGLYKKYKIERT